jgi:tripartite-type tricarboxylate transporter receptor subunit TctC
MDRFGVSVALARSSCVGIAQAMPWRLPAWLVVVASLAHTFGPAVAQAQSAPEAFPSRPLRIIVPFGPGSGTDIATRLVAQHLEAAVKQSVVTDNRPGASGSIAAAAVARAAPDGYTLLMGTNSTHGANSGLIAKMTYDPIKDFVPVGLVGIFSSFLVVNPALPVRTPAELIAYGKANPKALTFAAGNTSSLIMGEMFGRGAGIEMLRVPYTSNPAGLTDVIAGRVSVMFPDIGSSIAHVKAGSVRALAVVTLGERSPQAPELPTVAESVLPNFHFVGWIGLFAPAGTPAPVLARISAEMQKIMVLPEVAQRFQQMGAEAKWIGPAEFRSFVGNEVTRLPKILADIGVQPQ